MEKKKLRKAWNKGLKMPASFGAAISKRLTGTHLTEEHKKHISDSHLGEKHPLWKGGRTRRQDGYILIKMWEHPRANSIGYVREHIVVAEKKLGRPLLKKEIVHHANGYRDDNRPENLFIFPSHSAHMKHHAPNKDKKYWGANASRNNS